MASAGKKKTTMAKLNRERKLRERRLDKQTRKDARKSASTDQQVEPGEMLTGGDDPISRPDAGETAIESVAQSLIDA